MIGLDGKARTRVVDTIVAFKPLSPAEIDGYVASGEGMGKAGGYAIQGRAEAFVRYPVGQPFGRRRPAAVRDARAAARRRACRLAEWLYEAGIGEARAALVEDGADRRGADRAGRGGLRVGAVARRAAGRARRRGPSRVELADGGEALIDARAARRDARARG